MNEQEIWRDIPGFEGLYSVSSHGRVRSEWGIGRFLVPVKRCNGYLHVQLCPRDGTKKQASIHTLVAAAFIGPRPHRHDVSHVDGCKANNSLHNLRYEPHSENCMRRMGHGARPARGEQHPHAKLSDEKVREIFSLYEAGRLQREIADAMGITQSNVSRVLSGKQWAHL